MNLTENVVDLIDEQRRRRAAGLILELDLTEPLVTDVPHDPVSAVLARRRTPLPAVLDGLRRAARDPRVEALVVKLGGARPTLALATAQELRDAVRTVREADKLTVAWAETFGEADRGSVAYYLASAFGEVWLQPSGDVCLNGIAVELPFLRGALDKVGVTPELAQRYEYKNAANTFTERGFTDAHREATERLVASATEQLVQGIAVARHLDPAAVGELADRAPLFSDEAVDAGLVDRLGYRDEVYAAVRDRVGEGAVLRFVSRYRREARSKLATLSHRLSTPAARRETVAVIPVSGPIHLGRSGRRPVSSDSAGAATVTAALRAAAGAPDVKAVVLRVDSPGGSYVASDAIWRQVDLTREAGTPVVVSMGDVAASGGYYVAMNADVVVAEPGTVTGSIGVLSGKAVVDRLVDRLGIGHEEVAGARHGLMFSALRGFTEEEWERLNAWLDRIYDDFVAKAAAGRQLPPDHVHEVARGRVWTGADAKERGLVDELGGLTLAVDLARERAGLPPSDEPEVVSFPRTPFLARVRPPASSEDPAAATAQVAVAGWGMFAGLASRLGFPAYGPLMLPGDLTLR